MQQLARLQYHSLTTVHVHFEDFLGEVHWLDTSSFVHYQVSFGNSNSSAFSGYKLII